MAQRTTSEQIPPTATDGLPAAVALRLDGDAAGQAILGWSEFDLDSENRFATQFAVLTDQRLIQIRPGGRQVIALKDIQEVRIVEGLGVDRLAIVVGDTLAAEMRYSRKHRRTMTRLHRKLRAPYRADRGSSGKSRRSSGLARGGGARS